MASGKAFYLAISLIIILFVSPCYAQDQSEKPFNFTNDDPRLNQTITYESIGYRLADILTDISSISGVELFAGKDQNEWTVYDRKLVIYVKDIKLIDLMKEISTDLSFTWYRNGDAGKWEYIISQTQKQRDEEVSLRTSFRDNQIKQITQKREDALNQLLELNKLNADEIARLKQTNPWKYVLATETFGANVGMFLNSYPEAREAYLQGTKVSFPVSQLPADLQEMIKKTAVSYEALMRDIGAGEDKSNILANFDKLKITINRISPDAAQNIVAESMLGKIDISLDQDSLEIPIFNIDSPMAEALGTAIIRLKSGTAKEEVAKQLEIDTKKVIQLMSMKNIGEIDLTSDPVLKTNLSLYQQKAVAPLTVPLKSIFESTNLNIISDYYSDTSVTLSGEVKPLGEQLANISISYGTDWKKSGNVLRFRDKVWFIKRTYEVPQVWLDYWFERGKQNVGLGLDDLTQIANLRDEQLEYSIMTNKDLLKLGAGEAVSNRYILRFYNSLYDEQKNGIRADKLPVVALSDVQWQALKMAVTEKGEAKSVKERGLQFLKMKESKGDSKVYTFLFFTEPTIPPLEFKVNTGLVYLNKK